MTLRPCQNALSPAWTEMRSMGFVLGMRVGFDNYAIFKKENFGNG